MSAGYKRSLHILISFKKLTIAVDNLPKQIMFRLTHTDLKPENILFTSSDWEISYNARKRKDVRKVKSTEVTILNKKIKSGEKN